MRSVTSISVFTGLRRPQRDATAPTDHKNFISPRIFNFGPRSVTAYVKITPLESNGLNTYPGLSGTALAVGNAVKVEDAGAGCFWFGPRGFAVSDRRSCFGRLLRSRCISLSPWLCAEATCVEAAG